MLTRPCLPVHLAAAEGGSLEAREYPLDIGTGGVWYGVSAFELVAIIFGLGPLAQTDEERPRLLEFVGAQYLGLSRGLHQLD